MQARNLLRCFARSAAAAARSFHLEQTNVFARTVEMSAAGVTSADAGDLVSWSVDANGHVFPANGGAADEEYPHVVVDHDGVEWTVREVATPQSWARAARCLVLNSRECVRRIWSYPPSWRTLHADQLLRLGTAD